MGLNLIRRGAKLHPNAVTPGTGWVNTTTPGGINPYIFDRVDQCLTVTATNCDGVRIYDWGRNPNLYVESAQEGKMHSAVALVSGAGYGPVVRVLNPTENTEVTIMSETLPPPYFVGLLRAWRGGCRGAETYQARPRRVPSPGRAAHRRHTRVVDSVGRGANLPTGWHLLGGVHRRYERGETRNRNRGAHVPRGGDLRQGRLPAAAIHAGRASNPRHTRLNQGVGA